MMHNLSEHMKLFPFPPKNLNILVVSFIPNNNFFFQSYAVNRLGSSILSTLMFKIKMWQLSGSHTVFLLTCTEGELHGPQN